MTAPSPRIPSLRRLAVALASLGVLAVVAIPGCLMLHFGRSRDSYTAEDGTFVQKGKVNVAAGGHQDIYYPVPYASPPNLQAYDSIDDVAIEQQAPDHFRVHNASAYARDVEWTARGVRREAP